MRIHLIGIKGVGMTALAQILKNNDHQISGSDIAEDFQTKQALDKLQIQITEFDAKNITNEIDQVIHSAAMDLKNPEIIRAAELEIPIQSYPQAVAELFNKQKGIAIAGTHGKTTVAAMLGHILKTANFDPTVIVGAPVINFDRMNARSGKGELFVLEACEYRNHFHNYKPYAAIVTNIDYDHPDFFQSAAEYEQSFAKFAKNINPSGVLIIPARDKSKMPFSGKIIEYALSSETAGVTAFDIQIQKQTIRFHVMKNQRDFGEFELQIPGKHNVENALGAIAMADFLGVSKEQIQSGLATFLGTARRQEIIGEKNNVLVIDDYGHHPSEIQATISALKEFYPNRRFVVAFQAHTHTRTRALLPAFAKSFDGVDLLFLPEIFPSAREKDFPDKVSPEELSDAIKKENPNLEIIVGGKMLKLDEIKTYAEMIRARTKPGDLLLTLGAGETDKLAEEFLKGN
ncbi:MAG: UDP-N-acetylmuramate--L-alanine ligase [Patescibacteria group bacterium]|nr:UDP-N-acetylmuramate--L-alanine ligase [Patescibacteria group bacterium]